ncbi:hypothetical protein Droror1_Dr00019242 [Drosera rotundifolia]
MLTMFAIAANASRAHVRSFVDSSLLRTLHQGFVGLQSSSPLRTLHQGFVDSFGPRPLSYIGFELLLLYTLQSSEPFPIALMVLLQTLRAGCSQAPETQMILSSAWLDHRCRFQCVGDMFLDMKSNGYRPDCGTCNYIISSLCAVDQLDDAIEVLGWMTGVTCIPDLDSFCPVIVTL